MESFLFRKATAKDIDFLVKTIIEAKKSGTKKNTYETIFGLTKDETKKYLTEMLLEEVDNCELSISSFLVAERDGEIVASVCAWIEGFDNDASSFLRSNLIKFVLPKDNVIKAISLEYIFSEIQIECVPNTIQIGWVYVLPSHRGQGLAKKLIDKQIKNLLNQKLEVSEAYIQVFGGNDLAIRAYEKSGFETVLIKKSNNKDILKYLPSNIKILMLKKIKK